MHLHDVPHDCSAKIVACFSVGAPSFENTSRNTLASERCIQLGGLSDPCVDFAAKHPEVDRLGKKRLGTNIQCLPFCLSIAIGGNHDDRDIGPNRFGLGQQFKAAHPWHVDIGQNQDE